MSMDGPLNEIGVEEARSTLGRLVDDVTEGDPLLLTKRGKPAAVLMSVAHYQRLLAQFRERREDHLRDALLETKRLLAHSPEGASLIDEAIEALDDPAR